MILPKFILHTCYTHNPLRVALADKLKNIMVPYCTITRYTPGDIYFNAIMPCNYLVVVKFSVHTSNVKLQIARL